MDSSDLRDLTRREFVQIGATIAALMSCGNAWSATSQPSPDFEHGNPLSEFGYGDVNLSPGLHQAQFEQTHEILMGLDEDSLLRPMRLAAGLPAPGRDLGGWLLDDRWRGTFGQWLSALSRYYAASGDESSRAKVHRLVEAFGKTIEFGAKTPQAYDKLDSYS